MNYDGLIIGVVSFIVIGMFHPLVIKGEYYFSYKIWPFFLLIGLICCFISIIISDKVVSAIVAIIGFASLWSIHELREQKKRVDKGWFPKNPNRKK